jgi:hypothetical protein
MQNVLLREDDQSIAPRIKNARGDGAPELLRSDALTSTVFQFGRALICFIQSRTFAPRCPPLVMASRSLGRPAGLAKLVMAFWRRAVAFHGLIATRTSSRVRSAVHA